MKVTDYGISGESIICFAGEDWWYHHPHSKNHILKRLAGSNRVLFVNSLGLGLPAASHPDFFLKIRRKLKSSLRWLRKVSDGLYVMTPLNLPFYGSPRIRAMSARLLALQIRIAMVICRIRDPILWVAIPTAAEVAKRLSSKLVIYQVSDKYDANEDSELGRDVIREFDRRLKEMASVVMYSGLRLYEEGDGHKRFFLEQGVDYEHFATESQESAPELADIPGPILGYLGTMDYVMDVPLIEEVARRRPDWHWVMVGLKSNLVQIAAPNVHFVGSKPYEDVPKYVKKFDICVLPWRQGNAFIEYGSAIKVREYLATGKPVVISPLYEYNKTPGVRLYRTPEEFIAAVEDGLKNDTPAQRELRQATVKQCTWDTQTKQVGQLIRDLLSGRPDRRAPDFSRPRTGELEVASAVAPSGSAPTRIVETGRD
jgi:glycosyltransferase involved in cell wall biosynthesis